MPGHEEGLLISPLSPAVFVLARGSEGVFGGTTCFRAIGLDAGGAGAFVGGRFVGGEEAGRTGAGRERLRADVFTGGVDARPIVLGALRGGGLGEVAAFKAVGEGALAGGGLSFAVDASEGLRFCGRATTAPGFVTLARGGIGFATIDTLDCIGESKVEKD